MWLRIRIMMQQMSEEFSCFFGFSLKLETRNLKLPLGCKLSSLSGEGVNADMIHNRVLCFVHVVSFLLLALPVVAQTPPPPPPPPHLPTHTPPTLPPRHNLSLP